MSSNRNPLAEPEAAPVRLRWPAPVRRRPLHKRLERMTGLIADARNQGVIHPALDVLEVGLEIEAATARRAAEVTLRDLIRAMRSFGMRLTPTEKDTRGRQYRYLVRNGVQEGDLVTYTDDDSRWLRLEGRDGWGVDMKNPTPAEVFDAARLLGWEVPGA